MDTEINNILTYSKPIKINKNIENYYIKKKYQEYDYIINNISELNNTDITNTEINNKNIINLDNYINEIYDLKESFFNPDKHSPPNSWKNRLIERIKFQNK